MPIIKSRYDYIKVYRPNGTKYGQGQHVNLIMAMNIAKKNFLDEFGYEPRQAETNWEVVGVTGAWVVDFFHIKDF